LLFSELPQVLQIEKVIILMGNIVWVKEIKEQSEEKSGVGHTARHA